MNTKDDARTKRNLTKANDYEAEMDRGNITHVKAEKKPAPKNYLSSGTGTSKPLSVVDTMQYSPTR